MTSGKCASQVILPLPPCCDDCRLHDRIVWGIREPMSYQVLAFYRMLVFLPNKWSLLVWNYKLTPFSPKSRNSAAPLTIKEPRCLVVGGDYTGHCERSSVVQENRLLLLTAENALTRSSISQSKLQTGFRGTYGDRRQEEGATQPCSLTMVCMTY